MSGDRRDEEVAPTVVSPPTEPGAARSANDVTLPARGQVKPEDGRLAAGQKLGRYEIEYLIGRGGMGEVYAAYDPNLDRPVAVKVLLASLRSEAQAARLVREAQALARLQHPNVVAVYDAGEDHGQVFLAMQYVEGETLAVHLRAQPRRWPEVIALFVAAGRGLAAAHAAGIIHRDFKPSNVLVDRAGHVAVTDFGLARQAGDPLDPPGPTRPSDPMLSSGRRPARPSDPALSTALSPGSTGRRGSRQSHDLTRQGELVGTPAYMPVEQMAGAEITPATDQFAFCVAVWEALFSTHPLAGDDTDGSPVAFSAALDRNVLHLPERHAIPKRIVAALSRGLARDPAARWPGMDPLLAELERGARPRHLALIAACGALVVAGGTVAAVLALQADAAPSCGATASARIATVWGPDRATAIATRFTSTDRGYAAATAGQVTGVLGTYATAWTTAATDACTASRGGDAGARERADRRLACLDRAHAALGAITGMLTGELGGNVVDGATAIVRGLPRIGDCSGGSGGGESSASPTPEVAKRLPALEARLHMATAVGKIGQPRLAADQLAVVVSEARGLDWAPFQVRLDHALAVNQHDLGHGQHSQLMAVIERARGLGMHRLALDAAVGAMLDAPDATSLEAAVTAGLAAAAAVGGPEAALEVGLAHGRGLARQRKFQAAASLCRDGRKSARNNHWDTLADQATVCLLECLLPLGQYGELAPVLEDALAEATTKLGAEHPTVSSFLEMKASVLENQGKLVDAEVALERSLAIRRRTYGDNDIRVAAALRELGGIASEQDDKPRARELFDQALAIAVAQTPPPDDELWKIHRDLGMLAMDAGDHAKVREHFDLSIASATRLTSADSLEVGFLLVMYGQYQTAWDLEAGLASLREAIAIFVAHDDPRVAVVRGALGGMLMHFERWNEAIPLLEEALAKANRRDVQPRLLGQMSFSLAKALVATKKKLHARFHAEDALEHYARAGDAAQREAVRDWIEDRRLPAYKAKLPEHP